MDEQKSNPRLSEDVQLCYVQASVCYYKFSDYCWKLLVKELLLIPGLCDRFASAEQLGDAGLLV